MYRWVLSVKMDISNEHLTWNHFGDHHLLDMVHETKGGIAIPLGAAGVRWKAWVRVQLCEV